MFKTDIRFLRHLDIKAAHEKKLIWKKLGKAKTFQLDFGRYLNKGHAAYQTIFTTNLLQYFLEQTHMKLLFSPSIGTHLFKKFNETGVF